MILGTAWQIVISRRKEAVRSMMTSGTVIGAALVYSAVLFSVHLRSADSPALTFAGAPIVGDYLRCFAPLAPAELEEMAGQWSSRVTLWPCSYYNLQHARVNIALDSLYLSILVVPDEFLEAHLADRMSDGRLPQASAPECIVGSDAVRAWRLATGQTVRLKPGSAIQLGPAQALQETRPTRVTIVGVLADGMDYQMLRGAIILTESAFASLYEDSSKPNLVFAYATNGFVSTSLLEHEVIKAGLTVVHTRPSFLRGGTSSLMLLVVFGAVWITFQMSASSNIEQNAKSVGVLSSLGVSRWRIASIFGLADGIVQASGIVVGGLLAKYGLMLLNLGVMHETPRSFGGYSNHFRFHVISIVAAIGVLAFSAAVRALRTVRFLRRTSPGELLRDPSGAAGHTTMLRRPRQSEEGSRPGSHSHTDSVETPTE
jgi:hypothetical protein